MTNIATRSKIENLETELLKHPQLPIPIKHTFSGGMYAREATIPRGAVVTGRVHKSDHLNFLVRGSITVVTEDGEAFLQAPCTIPSKAGTKRAAIAHEECVWITVLKTDCTDPVLIEAEMTAANHECLLPNDEHLLIEG